MNAETQFAYEIEGAQGQPTARCQICREEILDLECAWLPASNRRFWLHKHCTREDAQFAISPSEAFKDWQERAGATYEVFLHNSALEDRACLKAGLRNAEGALIEAAHLDLEPECRSQSKLFVALLDPMRCITDLIHLRLILRGTWRRLHNLAYRSNPLE